MVKDINKRISQIIEHYNYTNSEFADEIDVQRSSISHIISGRNKPSLDFLIKVKEQFPDLSWDWLINGEGEMMIKKEVVKEEKKATSLPDLFSMIDDDNFGRTESEDTIKPKISPSESSIPVQDETKSILNDSQPLEIKEILSSNQNTDNQENKIKRIVLFYENGKFESYEP